jgi:hypothetical protein
LPQCIRKGTGWLLKEEALQECIVLKEKLLAHMTQYGNGEKGGPQNEGKSHDVIENKRPKSVTSCFATMLMKRSRLNRVCQDVDENK